MRWLIRSALDDLMPSGGAVPGVLDTDWDDFIGRFEEEASPTLRAGVVAGTLVYTLSPLLTLGLPVPSFALPAKLRDRHANKVTEHPIYLVRQAVFVLKLTAGFNWGAHPKVRRSVNLEPYPADPTDWRQA